MLINEIFCSLQGEGHWSGTPMVFIRLSGCNLNCSFCDTKHQEGTEMSLMEIIDKVLEYPTERVCITGGEPCIQDLSGLLIAMQDNDIQTHLETNGTIYQECLKGFDWITVSPKGAIQKVLGIASEIKVVISSYLDLGNARNMYYPGSFGTEFFVQPESCREDMTELCVQFCKANPKWRLSLQTQKLIRMP